MKNLENFAPKKAVPTPKHLIPLLNVSKMDNIIFPSRAIEFLSTYIEHYRQGLISDQEVNSLIGAFFIIR